MADGTSPNVSIGDGDLEPFQMTVLSKKFEEAITVMSQSLMSSARSGVINSARDFTSAFTLYDSRQFMYDKGLPVHAANVHLIPEYTLDKFDDISAGDCFLTNSTYAGNTHHADYTLHVPVFYEGEPLFWVLNRAHQADVGAPQPTTYVADAKDIYEEGPHLPAVRIQEDYEDKEDLIRTLKLNIRAGDWQWYGDYRAQVAAVRKGEEMIQEICAEYGVELVRQFTEEWIDYGERMMEAELEKLPEAEIQHTTRHDPVPFNDAAPEGIPVTVKVKTHPDEGRISVDLTDNGENIPAGFNLSEATTIAGVYGGIFYNIDSDLPQNHGAIKRVSIEMDEGKIVGEPEPPVGTSVATTNVCDALFNAMQAVFGDLGEPYGVSEGTGGTQPHCSVVSGTDFRRDDEFYINQLIFNAGGGASCYGHDGWITYGQSNNNGVVTLESIENAEQNYPILVHQYELATDTGGAGRWRGGPGVRIELGPREDEMTAAYCNMQTAYPPQGIVGGDDGTTTEVHKRTQDGELEELPGMGYPVFEAGETLVSTMCGGGGYGDPTERDPEAVKRDVEAGLVSPEAARDSYGVVIEPAESGISLDEEKTRTLREERTEER
jgi:N-methylhydantoinase B